ncbi:MAG: DUF4118 domain-containing protein [Chitinophagaceae bacterium]|nr:DUF4118 domain-containing protein [Chitinophagaceae bacterium]
MPGVFTKRFSKSKQYLISLLMVGAVSAICFGISQYLGYRVVAFILLLTVSIIAISFDILPVLLSATLSAFIWDFFFIPPRFNFHVGDTEDVILLVMYFLIALINAVLTYKIRTDEKANLKKEEKVNTLKLYDTLLNSLSHELRTPIATIIAATDNLKSTNNSLSRENKEELVSEIAKASFRLNQQVENLLNMSRLESGFVRPKMDWCDISELVYETADKVEENKTGHRIRININPNIPLIKTDKILLGQVIYNLLNNAYLHTKPDVRIHVSAMMNVDILQLIVEDNGDGFPDTEIENVFDKFYRLKQSKAGGTGLGLSIVKGFTEALKGHVGLQNISSGGARFTIEIPCESSKLKMTP